MKTVCLLLFVSAASMAASGCRPAPSTSSSTPAPPVGVTSKTEHALDSQPGAGSIRGTVNRDEGLVDLKEIAMYYQIHQADGPQARDLVLNDVKHDHGKLYQAIQEGRYVLLPGDPARAPTGASATIVAYMRDAPTAGGVVALLDGSARNMPTAQEFQSAAKLGQ